MRNLVMVVMLTACGGAPDVEPDADPPAIDAGMPAAGRWAAIASPNDSCSFGAFVGGGVLDVVPDGAGAGLALQVEGGPMLTVTSVTCGEHACYVDASEPGVDYFFLFTVDELRATAASGQWCQIPISGTRVRP